MDVKMVVLQYTKIAGQFQTMIRFPAVKQGLIVE
jgi:hypothetical protein